MPLQVAHAHDRLGCRARRSMRRRCVRRRSWARSAGARSRRRPAACSNSRAARRASSSSCTGSSRSRPRRAALAARARPGSSGSSSSPVCATPRRRPETRSRPRARVRPRRARAAAARALGARSSVIMPGLGAEHEAQRAPACARARRARAPDLARDEVEDVGGRADHAAARAAAPRSRARTSRPAPRGGR